MSRNRIGAARILAIALIPLSASAQSAEIETLDIGLSSDLDVIEALSVEAGPGSAPIVALVGGLEGEDRGSRAIRDEVEAYAGLPDAQRGYRLLAVPVANPDSRTLEFPPTGAAYRENAESHTIWRWLGLTAPDLVFVIGDEDAGLADALLSNDVAGVAPLSVTRESSADGLLDSLPREIPRGLARLELEQRRARTPLQLAQQLAPVYSQSFNTLYIDGMGLIAHLGLGNLEHVEQAVAPYVDGTTESLGGRFGVSTLVLAGHLVFAELAERTGDPRYIERARAAADLAFDDNGEMLEAVPGHGEMSDAIFMGASILAAAGDLTGEQRYFDMAVRQIDFMNTLVRRDDGLYRHSPLNDAAWGRGNGFAAIGYALTLSKLPTDHPAFDRLLGEYVDLMTVLVSHQNDDGTWRQLVDHPGAYHETSSTAIIGFSMQRGLNRGWLGADEFDDAASRAFRGLLTRTDLEGVFIDVSESTNKQPDYDDYLYREALFGPDQRTGSFAMLFAVERARPSFGYDKGLSLQSMEDPGLADFLVQCSDPPAQPRTLRARPNLPATPAPDLAALPTTSTIQGVVASGQRWTTVWAWDGNNVDGLIAGDNDTLLFANNEASNVMRFDTATGRAIVIHDDTNTGGAVSRGKNGSLFVASRGLGGAITQLEPVRRVLANSYQGDPLECQGGTLNDIAADRKGGVYATGTGLGLVYANSDGVIRQFGEGLGFTNGIVLSPDEETLYVTNGAPLLAFDVEPDGALTNQRTLAELPEGRGDGSAVDNDGRIYVSNGSGVTVISPDGEVLGSIPGPRGLHGVAFGGPDKRTLYGIVFYGGRGTPSARNQIIAMPMIAQGYTGRAK